MYNWDEISGPAVAILVIALLGAIVVTVWVASLVAGAITGGAIGLGYVGYKAYQKKKLGPWEEPGDGSGSRLYTPGGIFLGEEYQWH